MPLTSYTANLFHLMPMTGLHYIPKATSRDLPFCFILFGNPILFCNTTSAGITFQEKLFIEQLHVFTNYTLQTWRIMLYYSQDLQSHLP